MTSLDVLIKLKENPNSLDGLIASKASAIKPTEISIGKEPDFFTKATRFLQQYQQPFVKPMAQQRGEAGAAYALQKQVLPKASLSDIKKNLPAITKELGIRGVPTGEEIIQASAYPWLAMGAATAPLVTLGSMALFVPVREAINFGVSKWKKEKYKPFSGKGLSELLPEDIGDPIKGVVDLAEIIGTILIVKKVSQKSPQIIEALTKQKIVENKLPEKLFISSDKVKSIFQTGEKISAAEKDLVGKLGLTGEQYRQALKTGVDIEIPAEKIVTLVDKPLWGKIKGLFSVAPSEPIITKAGETPKLAGFPQPVAEPTKPPLQLGAPNIAPASIPAPGTPVAISPKSNWREILAKTPDISKKADILRAIADVSKSKQELQDVLDITNKTNGLPEKSNIIWAVEQNPTWKQSQTEVPTLPKLEIQKPIVKTDLPEPIEPTPQDILSPDPERVGRRQRVIEAIKQAKPIRGEQERGYTEERRKRIAIAEQQAIKIGGKAGYEASLAALAGELPKEAFEPIKLDQVDVDGLFNDIEYHPDILPFQKITAKNGLAKLLGEKAGGVPTESELHLLNKVFGTDFVDVVLKKRHIISRLVEAGYQLANIPRSIMSSIDLSFGGRQGIFAAPAYRKQFFDAWSKQFKIMGSEKAYQESQKILISNPNFPLANESGVQFTEMDQLLDAREERFKSQWAEKIPVIGQGVRASGRAYTAFANQFRMSIFNDMIKQAEEQGLDPKNNLTLTKNMASFVNIATGRGSLPPIFERSSLLLNALFFSPRLIFSRMAILSPTTYGQAQPFVRKQALKTMFSFAAYVATILTAAKLTGLADVETDTTSSDAYKLRIGNTRIDIMGGLQQYLVLFSRLWQGKYKSSATGKVTKLEGGFNLNKYTILMRALEAKEAPVFSFVNDWLKGKNFKGEKFEVSKALRERITPMFLSDLYDIATENPDLLPVGILAFFGFGTQTYKSRKPIRIKR